jgi:hypothetical protein
MGILKAIKIFWTVPILDLTLVALYYFHHHRKLLTLMVTAINIFDLVVPSEFASHSG